MIDLQIRKYKETDFDKVKNVCRENKYFLAHKESYTDNYYTVFVGIVHKKIIGVLVISRHSSNFYIDHIEVDPDYRGKGIGTELLIFTEKYVKQQNLKVIRLDTLEINKKAQQFYKKNKFEQIGWFKNLYEEKMQMFRKKI